MQILQNYKLVTQILCFILIIMLLCFGMLLGTIYLNFYYFEEVVLDSTLSILNKQFKSEIKGFTFSSQQLIEKYQQREKKRLESVNMIYQFTWDLQINLISTEQCLNKMFSKYSGQCQLCYGIMDSNINTQKTNYEKYLRIASLYSVIFLMADNSFDILFAGTSKEKFMAIWPQQGLFPNSFNPQTRPWFQLEHNQPNSSKLYQTHFTQPYIHVGFHSITVSHTQSLYDKDFSRIGVVTIQLNFSSTFPSFLQNNTKIKGYILDENFYILQGDGLTTSVSTFFNQNITGFDQSNMDNFKSYLNDGEIFSRCQKLNKQLLCLRNVYNQEFIVEASKLSNYNQIFVLVFDPSSDLQILELRLIHLSEQIKQKINLIVFQTVVPYLLFLIFSMALIYNITSRISKIILQAQAQIYKDNNQVFKFLQFNVFKVEQKIQLNILEKLEISFANLNDKIINAKGINPQCIQMINAEAYPKRIMKRRFYWQFLLPNLDNQKLNISKLAIKKIISESHRKHPQTS